jgi:sugar lactone lactonase YvrE
MTLTANGDALVSDGEGGGIYRVLANGDQLERLDGGDFISPQTPAMHPDDKHIFVPDYVRGIGLLDMTTKQVRWLSSEGRFALDGIDGLYFDHGKLIAVQNGSSPERVIMFTLDETLSRVTADTVVERATSTLGDPTHGVVVEQKFYYIANSGWDVIDEHGNMKPGVKQSQAHVMKFEIKR